MYQEGSRDKSTSVKKLASKFEAQIVPSSLDPSSEGETPKFVSPNISSSETYVPKRKKDLPKVTKEHESSVLRPFLQNKEKQESCEEEKKEKEEKEEGAIEKVEEGEIGEVGTTPEKANAQLEPSELLAENLSEGEKIKVPKTEVRETSNVPSLPEALSVFYCCMFVIFFWAFVAAAPVFCFEYARGNIDPLGAIFEWCSREDLFDFTWSDFWIQEKTKGIESVENDAKEKKILPNLQCLCVEENFIDKNGIVRIGIFPVVNSDGRELGVSVSNDSAIFPCLINVEYVKGGSEEDDESFATEKNIRDTKPFEILHVFADDVNGTKESDIYFILKSYSFVDGARYFVKSMEKRKRFESVDREEVHIKGLIKVFPDMVDERISVVARVVVRLMIKYTIKMEDVIEKEEEENIIIEDFDVDMILTRDGAKVVPHAPDPKRSYDVRTKIMCVSLLEANWISVCIGPVEGSDEILYWSYMSDNLEILK